jgi:hypothetical protein
MTVFSVIAFGALAQGKAMDHSAAPTMGTAPTEFFFSQCKHGLFQSAKG